VKNQFKPYPWQIDLWQHLLKQKKQNRLSFPFLFYGPYGLGKVHLSLAFAASLLCDDASSEAACGVCQSCFWCEAQAHPDFFHLMPEAPSKAVKVDQLRDLIASLEKTAHRSIYQVAVIESIENMNHSAANALLKTLEEPLENVVIVLIANALNTLPSTMISRCQQIRFSPVSGNNQIIQWMSQRVSADFDFQLLLKLSEGAPLRALEYIESGYFELRNQVVQHLLEIQRRSASPIAVAALYLNHNLSLVLLIMMSLLADVLRLQHVVHMSVLSHSDCKVALQFLAKAHNRIKIHDYFQFCQHVLAAVKSGVSINTQLMLENIWIEYYRCCESE